MDDGCGTDHRCLLGTHDGVKFQCQTYAQEHTESSTSGGKTRSASSNTMNV